MLGLVRGVVRGAVAWLVGFGVTVGLSVAGIVDGSGVGTAARTYVSAHAVPPESASIVVAVPVLAIGVAGVRAGRSLKSGVTGRVRSFVRSVRGGTGEQLKAAATTGALLVVGYAAVGLVVAALVDGSTGDAVVGGALFALVVGVPAAIAGARL
jgi:hypothetical protein